MQNKKKAYTIAIITFLTLSMILAAIPMVSAQFAITAPTSGSHYQVGDKVLVSGSNASFGGLVEVYWEITAPGNLLNTTYADGIGDYSCFVTIPEDIEGSHYIIVRDDSTGTTVSVDIIIDPKIELTPTSGIPGDSVDVAGTGFAATSNITLTFMNTTPIDVTPTPQPETNSLGSFSATFEVPTVDYDMYPVNATDDVPNTALANFTVGATITLTPVEGPTGKVVTIAGRGFNTTVGTPINITVDTVIAPTVAPINTTSAGNFTGQFIVPTLVVGTYDVNATDGTYTATKPFNVTGTTWIELTPTAGFPGWEVTIEGVNFTAIADTEVTVTFGALTVKTLYTNTTGGFKGTFDAPSLPTATYPVNATDANDLNATANFTIAITLIALNPTEGPTGTNVTITGYGFTANDKANVTIDTKLVILNTTINADKQITDTFIVPTLPIGTHTVIAKDYAGLTYSESFEVTKTTELIITPSSAPVGYEVSIVGNYFSGNSTVEAFLYNATDSWQLTAKTGSFNTLKNGTFVATFNVSELDLGDYFINATDTYLFPGDLKLIYVLDVPFSVVEVYIEMRTRATEYLQGDMISFYIKCTFNYNMTINITDPTEYPVATVSILEADWETMDDWQVVPYEHATFTLPSDAASGTWNWTATIGTETATGLFNVDEKLTLSMVLERLDELDAKLVSLDGTVATISSSVGEIQVSIDAIHLKVVAIDGTVATIETDLGTMQGTVTSIDGNVATIQTDVGVVKADVSDVATDVSDIAEKGVTVDLTPVWIAVVLSLIAAIAACYAVATIHRKLA